MQERRSEVRNMCADMVEVHWRDKSGKACRETALLEDISPSGACIHLEKAIPPGSLVRWECPNQRFVGRVRYCTYCEIGYFAGVQFSPSTQWSKSVYRPSHLLEVGKLLERAKPRRSGSPARP